MVTETNTLRTIQALHKSVFLGASVCGSLFYDYPYQWTGGANGNFYIKFSSAAKTWKVTVQFDSNVNGLSVWNGAHISCSGSICSFWNAGYNANQAQGTFLTLGFQVLSFVFLGITTGLKNCEIIIVVYFDKPFGAVPPKAGQNHSKKAQNAKFLLKFNEFILKI